MTYILYFIKYYCFLNINDIYKIKKKQSNFGNKNIIILR